MSATASRNDVRLALAAWAAVLLLFWRALSWLTATALVRGQVVHAAVILVFGLVFLLLDRPGGNSLVLRFGSRAMFFYAGACLCAGLAGLLHQPVFMLCGLGFLAGAALLFVFGESVFRPALGFGLAFAVFTALSIFFPLADWPLRILAGKTAAWFLGLLGQTAQLGFSGTPPRLILLAGGRPFEVASECSGFGLISGCALLALLLVFSRRLRVADKLAMLALAPLIGMFSNALRIVVIVLLAPAAGAHYFAMHEAVGLALFLGTLALVWWLVAGLPERIR
ncbi:MAG: exosortase/archaeosortase family protein [Verrucomicrobiae bacterium]